MVRRNPRFVVLYYLANLSAGLLLALPFFFLLRGFAGTSLAGAGLATRIDMDFLVELVKENRNAVPPLGALSLFVAAAYWLLGLFLSGGAFTVFVLSTRSKPIFFWGSAARYFGRFLRLFLLCLPVFAALILGLPLIESGLSRLFFGTDPYQSTLYWGRWLKVGLSFLGIILSGMVLDYARVHAVVRDERRMRISLAGGVIFAFRNFKATFGLAFSLFLLGTLVLLAYGALSGFLSFPVPLAVIFLILLQQVYILFRMLLRLSLYSSEVALFRAVSERREGEMFRGEE